MRNEKDSVYLRSILAAFRASVLCMFALTALSRAEEAAPEEKPPPESAGFSVDSVVAGGAEDFKFIGGKWKAANSSLAYSVKDGLLSVENTLGSLSIEILRIRTAEGTINPKKGKTGVTGKIAKSTWDTDIAEFVQGHPNHVEIYLEIKKSLGPGSLRIEGTMKTALRIERTFPCDFAAPSFSTDGGVCLLTPGKVRALHVGGTTVIDAAGESVACTVEYFETSAGYDFAIVVPGEWLEKATYPLLVDPRIGSAAAATASASVHDQNSASAYGASKYLVAYRADTSFGDVLGQFINGDGTLSGSAFGIATGGTSQNWPRVAYTTAGGGVFGVVHVDGNDIWLRRFSTTGTLLGSVMVNNTATCDRVTYGDIASDDAGNFCVVFGGYKNPSGFWKIWAERRNSAGSLLTDDTELATGTSTTYVSHPDVVWNSGLSEWAVTWFRFVSAPSYYEVRARSWSSTLAAAGMAEVTVTTDAWPSGAEFPRIAYGAADAQLLVVWTRKASASETIVTAQRLNADTGALIGSPIAVEVESNFSSMGDVHYTPIGNRYFVSFKYYTLSPAAGGINGQVILPDGTRWDPRFVINNDTNTIEDQCRISYNPGLDQFLCSWTDIPSGGTKTDIWYARIDATPPAIPVGLTTKNTASSITIEWPKDDDASRYSVYRATVSGGGYTFLGAVLKGAGWPAVVAYSDTAVVVNTTYFYVIQAMDSVGNWSAYSAEVSESIDTIPPGAPTGLSGEGVDSAVELEWSPNSEPDLAGYNVYYRVLGGGAWTQDNTSLVTTTSYTVDGLSNGVLYEFAVKAVDTEPNESAFSATISEMPQDSSIPAAPVGLGATSESHTVHLTWTANSEPDLAGYNVYRSDTEFGLYVKSNAALVTIPSYDETGLTNGTTYWFKVSAVDTSTNESSLSASVSATPAVAAPTDLTYDSSSYNEIAMHWTGISDPDLDGYRVYRSATAGGPYAAASGLISTTTFTDTGLSTGTYYYVVRAVISATEESANSNEISGATTPVPIPTLPGANSRKTNDQTPVITGSAGASGWIVKLYEGEVLLGEGVATSGGAFSIATTVVLAEGEHVIQATATIDIAGSPTSGLSSGVVVLVDVTPPASPTGLVIVFGDNQADLRWAENAEPDLLGYNIYRREPGVSSWTKINTYPVTGTRYRDTEILNSHTYEYSLTAVDDAKDED